MRVLVTGATGFVGGRVALALRQLGWDVTLGVRAGGSGQPRAGGRLPEALAGLPQLEMEVARGPDGGSSLAAKAVGQWLVSSARPASVINALGAADVASCERDPAMADAVNHLWPAELARAMAEGAGTARRCLICFSTDQVFDGTQAPYRVSDPVTPIHHYGRSKVAMEAALRAVTADAWERDGGRGRSSLTVVAVRIPLVLGHSLAFQEALASGKVGDAGSAVPTPAHADKVVAQVRAGEKPNMFFDEWRTPVDVEDIAWACQRVIEAAAGGAKVEPIIQLPGPERLNRVEIGRRILLAAGLTDVIQAVPTPAGSKRPRDVSLVASGLP